MSSRPLSQSYFLIFVNTFCSAVSEQWNITCNFTCSSSPCSHAGAYKLLSIASFNFQAKQAADTKGPCVCFNTSACYSPLGQRGAEVGESWLDPSVLQQLVPCFGSWRSCSGRAGPSRRDTMLQVFLGRVEFIYLHTSVRVSGSCRTFPRVGMVKQCFQSQFGCNLSFL